MIDRTRDVIGIVTGDPPAVHQVEIACIRVPAGRREVRDVARLMGSIREVGLINPVTLLAGNVLVAGAHRLEACRQLGHEEIRAVFVTLDQVDAELAEIDENLIRNELTALERGKAMARRKKLYLAKHPETGHGKNPGKAGGGKKAKESKLDSFVIATAKKTGASASKVKRDVMVGEKIPEEVSDILWDSAIEDKQVELLKLAGKGMTPGRQMQVAKLIKSEADEHKKIKTVTQAQRYLDRQAAAAAGQVAVLPEACQIHTGDFNDVLAGMAADSVDLILTDPPYDRDSLPLYGQLAEHAARLLKPGGSLIAYAGHHMLPEILHDMGRHLRFWWLLALVH
jgi:ParB-like chromosome segregation protein Spo0J